MNHVPMFQQIDYDLKTGCWNWTGFKNPKGYGRTCHEGVQYLAHRVSAHIFLGFDLSSKLQVCHKCDNPSCINPKHFFIGTNRDNALDSVAKKRHHLAKKTHCKRGHEFTPENTYLYGTCRTCRTCSLECGRRRRRIYGN